MRRAWMGFGCHTGFAAIVPEARQISCNSPNPAAHIESENSIEYLMTTNCQVKLRLDTK